jgi:hypothetical protein
MATLKRIWSWLIHGPGRHQLDADDPGAPPGYLLDRNDQRACGMVTRDHGTRITQLEQRHET